MPLLWVDLLVEKHVEAQKAVFILSFLILGLGVVMDRRFCRREAPLCYICCGCFS